MLLALDEGHNNITIGAFLEGKLHGRLRLPRHPEPNAGA